MSSVLIPSKFEDLSDDILMDIFDLFSPSVYIYHSFFNLNQRLNRIINDSRLLISLDLSHLINPSNFAYHCQIMLPNMSKQLISLRLSNEHKLYEQIKIFLLHIRLSSFHALRQLSLIQITFDQLRRMLAEILSLNKLIRLDIDMFDGSGVSPNELNLIANTLLSKSNSIKVRISFFVIREKNVKVRNFDQVVYKAPNGPSIPLTATQIKCVMHNSYEVVIV
jgi:hypothetical protein